MKLIRMWIWTPLSRRFQKSPLKIPRALIPERTRVKVIRGAEVQGKSRRLLDQVTKTGGGISLKDLIYS